MTKKRVTYFLILIITCFIYIPVSAEKPSAENIIDNMENLFDVDTSSGIVKQTITTTTDKQREFKILMLSIDGSEKQYMEYLEPARVEGVKFLYLEDGEKIWTYFPRTGRLRKLARHHKKKKVMGSEFTYEDMSFGNISKKFNSSILREEKFDGNHCWVLEMIPTEKGPSYSKQLAWVRKQDFYPVKIEYYEQEDLLLKTLYQSDIKTVEEIPTSFKMVMETEETGNKTIMEILSIDYHVELDDYTFTTESLTRE